MTMTAELRRAITLQPVRPDRLDPVLRVLTDANRRVHEIGQRWLRDDDGFPPDGWRAKVIRENAEKGYVLLARVNGVPAATMTVSPDPDPEFAHAWPGGAGNARYIYRLGVAAAFAGLGSWMIQSARMMAWCDDVEYLRLDCAKFNDGLHRYYQSQGFTHVDTVDLPHRGSGALFQQPTGFVPED